MSLALQPRHVRVAVWAFLATLMLAALYMRVQAAVAHGGQHEYLAWSVENYFGAITPNYLRLSKELLGLHYSSLAYPPGYPAFLAALQFAGMDDLQKMRVVQAAIDCAGVPLVYFLLRRAGVAIPLCLCAVAVYATYPLWAVGSTFLLAEFVSPVLILAALSLAVLWGDRDAPSRALMAGSGAFLGAAALVRPDLLLLPGALALWFLWWRLDRRRLLAIGFLAAGFALPISLWGLHNRVQHGHWVFSTTGGGNTLWEGLGELPNDHGFVLDDGKAAEVLRGHGLEWHSVEADRFFRAEYLRAWREHPEFVAKVIVNRWKFVLTDSEVWLREARPFFRLKRVFDYGGAFLVVVALVTLRRFPVAVLLVGLPVTYALVSIGMTHWEARYGRYVHLSYLFALVLMVNHAVALAGASSRRAALALLAGTCALTAWGAGDALVRVSEAAQGARHAAPRSHQSLGRDEALDRIALGHTRPPGNEEAI